MTQTSILVVEDESIISMDIQNSLMNLGYSIAGAAANGLDAIKKVAELLPQLILMDIRLKGEMDGVEAAAEISKTQSVPIIFLSAYSAEDTLRRAKITEPYGFLTKPFEKRELHIAIEIALYKNQMEQKVKRLNHELAGYIHEVSQLNHEVEQFNYNVSHDLRGSIQKLGGYTAELKQHSNEMLDRRGRVYLSQIQELNHLIVQLIEDLLSLTMIKKGTLKTGPVDLTQVAKAIAKRLESSAPARKVDFVIADGLSLEGHLDLMTTVLESLFENAWKLTSKLPSATIELGVTRDLGQECYFVRNDGTEFDRVEASKIFVPFQSLQDLAKFPGDGVGLLKTQYIIRRYGGEIWANSQAGKGVQFNFTLKSLKPQ